MATKRRITLREKVLAKMLVDLKRETAIAFDVQNGLRADARDSLDYADFESGDTDMVKCANKHGFWKGLTHAVNMIEIEIEKERKRK